MPSFFIIAFIWRGLIFPGSIFLTTLPYSYRYSIIKCKHLLTRNDCSAAGNESITPGNHHHVIPRADSGICGGNVFGKRVLALCNEFSHIIADNHAVSRWGQHGLHPFCPFDPECQPAVRCADGCKTDPLIQYLPYPPGGREDECAAFRKEAGSNTPAELEVSDDLYPPQ